MSEPKRKAGSRWACTHCKYETVTQPGVQMLGLRCGVVNCKGTLDYRGGVFVYPSDEAFEQIDNYYLVGARPEKKRRAKLVFRNRITKGSKRE